VRLISYLIESLLTSSQVDRETSQAFMDEMISIEGEERDREEGEEELVVAALQLSRRISVDEFECIYVGYDMFDDADFSVGESVGVGGEGGGGGVPEELQQLASFFSQMMQSQGGGGGGDDEVSGGEVEVEVEVEDDLETYEDDIKEGEEEDEVERELEGSTSELAVVCGIPNEMHRAVFRCKFSLVLDYV
jgi:hypothetical protein